KASVAQHMRVDRECGTLISRTGIGDGAERASTIAQKASIRRQFGNEIHAGHCVSLSNIQQFGVKLANAVRYRCVALLGPSGLPAPLQRFLCPPLRAVLASASNDFLAGLSSGM